MAVPEQLVSVAEQIRATGQPQLASVRTILSWFDQQRRGRWVVSRVRSALRELGLTTFPEFESAYIGGRVELRPIRHDPKAVPGTVGSGAEPQDDELARDHDDPVARLRMLEAANRRPVSVTRDALVADAVTEMLMNDFSQLPVMANERTVHGMISWRAIGRRNALNHPCEFVRDCMVPAYEVSADMPLLTAVHRIVEHEVVLVRETDRTISGLVTTSDISLEFQELAEPFLLVGEIENHLRRLIDQRFTPDELARTRDPADGDRTVEGVEDLTFGEYVRLLEPEDNWKRLSLDLNRVRVIQRLHRVREIRNDVMHFNPDGTSPEDLAFLRDTVTFMQSL